MSDQSDHNAPGEIETVEQFSETRELLREFYAPYRNEIKQLMKNAGVSLKLELSKNGSVA